MQELTRKSLLFGLQSTRLASLSMLQPADWPVALSFPCMQGFIVLLLWLNYFHGSFFRIPLSGTYLLS